MELLKQYKFLRDTGDGYSSAIIKLSKHYKVSEETIEKRLMEQEDKN